MEVQPLRGALRAFAVGAKAVFQVVPVAVAEHGNDAGQIKVAVQVERAPLGMVEGACPGRLAGRRGNDRGGIHRSEERRVGKEWRARWSAEQEEGEEEARGERDRGRQQ